MYPAHTEPAPGVSVVVPCYDEELAVAETVRRIEAALDDVPHASELIVVDDGSRDGSSAILAECRLRWERVRVIAHENNRGYGAALKSGISAARYDRIVIADADGTYPLERIPELIDRLDRVDMVVGSRTGAKVETPWVRRPAKWALLRYGCLMSGADIEDINSGLRAVRLETLRRFWPLLPDTFSFTTTITLSCHLEGLAVEYVPIDYFRRVGRSSLRPIQDTWRIFRQVFRTVRRLRPFRALAFVGAAALAAVLLGVGAASTWGDAPPGALAALGVASAALLAGLVGDLLQARRTA